MVSVVGRGATTFEAREDAIRQALQQAVQQLVLAQRVIQNDKIALDQIASTMNGYVNKFEPKSTSVSAGAVTIEADVEVSESRVENFLATTAGGRTQIDPNNVLAAAQREALARRVRVELLTGFLSAFPEGAFEASSPKIANSTSNPGMVDVEYQAWISPLFIRRLKDGLKSLGAKRVEMPYQIDNTAMSSSMAAVCFFKGETFKTEGDGRNQTEFFHSRMSFGGLECLALDPVDTSPLLQGWNWVDDDLTILIGSLLLVEADGAYSRLKIGGSTVSVVFSGRQYNHSWVGLIVEGKQLIQLQFPVSKLDALANRSKVGLVTIPIPVGTLGLGDPPRVVGVVRSLFPKTVVAWPPSDEIVQEKARSFVPNGAKGSAPRR